MGELLSRYRQVIVAELNMGQLLSILRDRFLVDAKGLNKVQGQPFKVQEIIDTVPPAASGAGHYARQGYECPDVRRPEADQEGLHPG